MSTHSCLLRPAVVVLLTAAAAGCSGAPAQQSATTTPQATGSPSTSATTTTTSSATATTTRAATSPAAVSASPTAAATYPESQQEYTSEVVRAWGVGDRTRAARYATDAAVRRLFATIDPGGPGWALVGCDNAGPRPACTFADPGQGQRLVLFYDSAKLAQPRAVVDAEFISNNPASATQ